MQINEYQQWVSTFYKQRGWYQYAPFIRVNFLTEEVGELARAVRNLEIGRDRSDEQESDQQTKLNNVIEELGDVLDNIFILADKYGIAIDDVITRHQVKFMGRYVEIKR